MKNSKNIEKLVLDKDTIAKLSNEQAQEAEGGSTYAAGASCCDSGGYSCVVKSGVCHG